MRKTLLRPLTAVVLSAALTVHAQQRPVVQTVAWLLIRQ